MCLDHKEWGQPRWKHLRGWGTGNAATPHAENNLGLGKEGWTQAYHRIIEMFIGKVVLISKA